MKALGTIFSSGHFFVRILTKNYTQITKTARPKPFFIQSYVEHEYKIDYNGKCRFDSSVEN